MTDAIDTTIPTAHRTTTPARRGVRISRGARWTLAAVAAAAVAGTAASTVARPDLGSTRAAPVAGQPATAADLAYANEWTRRIEAMTEMAGEGR